MKAMIPKIKGHNIVLIGSFNPKIFHPAWFAAEGLIQKQEAEEAEIEIIHSDVSIFRCGWLRVEVTRERFYAGTVQESFDPLIRDLVLGTFNLLRYTPIIQMGVNRDMQFPVESEDAWHAVGHALAPKGIWEGILEKPGMLSLTMQGHLRRDGINGLIRVTIEPSKKIPYGVHFSVNDHFEVKDRSAVAGSDEIINVLKNNWEISYQRSEKIILSLWEKLP